MAIDDLELRALKLIYNAGSNGVLQKHLFERLPHRNSKILNVLAGFQEHGYAEKATSLRGTSKWGYLWTVTEAGKRRYVIMLAQRDTPAPIAPAIA